VASLRLSRCKHQSMNEPQAPDWRTWIQQGTEVFRKGRSAEAVSSFERACELSPGTAVAHVYLAVALHQQYISGALSGLVRMRSLGGALRWSCCGRGISIHRVGSQPPYLGRLALAERRFTDAREWYGKALTLQSNNAEIWYMLGVLAWQQGLRNEAIANFEKSASLDPLQIHAMENLSDMTGGEWLERSRDARSESVQASFAGGAESVDPDSGDPDWLLKWWVRAMALTLPPPPPPRVGPGRGSSSGATISFWPRIEPPPIRVAPAVQARKLMSKVEPEVPADWPEESPMRFVVVIGNDGRIGREVLISGNPSLAQMAVAALRE